MKLLRDFAIVGISTFTLLAIAAKGPSLNKKNLTEEIEMILKLGKNDLERNVAYFSDEQKLALKKIAFNPNSDLQVRWRALVLASRLLGPGMRTEIQIASKSEDWFMRSASMMAAHEISIEEAAGLARKLIKDKALVVRSAAVDILGATGDMADRRLLWRIIKDPMNVRKGQSLWIRSQALQLLAKNPYKSETPNFIEMLNDNDLELQAISINGLEKVSAFHFGSSKDSIYEHKKRWLNWWDTQNKSRTL